LLDDVLAGLLIIALPAYMILRSVVRQKGAGDNLPGRYLQTILIALALVAALLIDWLQSGRSAAALGLTLPVSGVGMAGLAIACAVLIGLFVAVRRQLKSNPAVASKLPGGLPQTSRQLAVFIVFAIVVGCSWEALYRGYLLWFLQPRVGLIGSIAVAATAYGLAHGVKNIRTVLASLGAALLFTIAYATTRSLWWLMLLHCGFPLLGAFTAYSRLRRPTPSAAVGDKRAALDV
jgi:membrane protease YdiL (CAAX protease family)